MSLLMRPGSTLLLLALVAFFVSFAIGGVPMVGSWLHWVLRFVAIFAAVGGVWLLIMGGKAEKA